MYSRFIRFNWRHMLGLKHVLLFSWCPELTYSQDMSCNPSVTQNYLRVCVLQVSSLFKDGTIGGSINIVIVGLVLLDEEQVSFSIHIFRFMSGGDVLLKCVTLKEYAGMCQCQCWWPMSHRKRGNLKKEMHVFVGLENSRVSRWSQVIRTVHSG